MDKKVLIVTGASKGMGFQIVLKALQAGYAVVGTSRSAEKLEAQVKDAMGSTNYEFTALSMAFTEESIKAAIDAVMKKYSRIDVLVNNAGYAILGAVEEMSMNEVRANFDVNVFGLLAITQAVLPHMRSQQSGHIINLASISGSVTGAAQGIYSASKAAVIMIGEALSEEVAPFNIQVTSICPGGVRTDFLDNSSMKRPEKQIAEYHVAAQTMRSLDRLNHNQSGDPALVADVILEVASMKQPPTRLYLGGSALAALQYKVNSIIADANRYVALSESIDN
ncbi:SDR family oxidoreductase [Veillonella agrestimuris]|uniref:SDR family oxidoreductase n=1 Tax=Veillonella agrestimuris TaxID=2941340 RepID=UPI002041CE28|nr:SDR family oxidoreductase [Veillonella agrestimuris]